MISIVQNMSHVWLEGMENVRYLNGKCLNELFRFNLKI